MYYVYILKSNKDGGYYIGSTLHLEDRIQRHLEGRSLATKNRRPLQVVYLKKYPTKTQATKAELYIKRQKSKKYIENLVKNKS